MDMIRKRLNDPEKILTPRTVHSKQKLPPWKCMGSRFHLMETFHTAYTQNLTESSFF